MSRFGLFFESKGGLETFRGALVMPLMNRGYRTGTIRFGLLTGCKGHVPGTAAHSALIYSIYIYILHLILYQYDIAAKTLHV